MKFYRSIVVCFGLMAGVAAETSLAQSSNDQHETMTNGGTTQVSTATVPPVAQTPAASGMTREQVMRELAGYQNSAQAEQLRDLYRGN